MWVSQVAVVLMFLEVEEEREEKEVERQEGGFVVLVG